MAQLFYFPAYQALSSSGTPLPGAKLSFFVTGTTTSAAVYADAARTTTLPNPIVADAQGKFPQIYPNRDVVYRARLSDSSNVQQWQEDGLSLQLFPRTSAEISAGVTPVNYAYGPEDVRRHGVVGDGATLDTIAFQRAVDAAPNSGVILVPPGLNCKIGQIHMSGKNLQFIADGATFTLSGNNAGFLLDGVVTNFRIYGGVYNGDGANRDSNPSLAQIAWTIGNSSGAQVANVKIFGAVATNCNVAFKIADSRAGGGTKTKNCHLVGCYAYNMVGQVGGMGYGFQFTQADASGLVGCVAENCERHGVYFSEGQGYTAADVQVIGGGFGAVRGGFCISRSANVSVTALLVRSRNDVGLVIDIDTQGLAPDNVSNGVVITGYESNLNTLGDIKVGTDAPATDGIVSNLVINGAVIRTMPSSSNNSILITSGKNIVIKGLLIDSSGAASNQRAISLAGRGGATYTDNITIQADFVSISSAGYAISVDSALCTSAQKLKLEVGQSTGGSNEYEFGSGEDAVTDVNLRYKRSNGHSARTYSSSGTNITIAAGGIDSLTFSASAATTVATISGGIDGDRIVLFFTNGNTTIKATNIYLAGAVDFVGTAADTLTLIYKSGAWRETGRSVN